jgi:hypothetical protein
MALVRPSDQGSLIISVNSIINQIENIEPWRYPADLGLYKNGWADGGSGILRVRFRRTFNGIVFWEGQVFKTGLTQDQLILGPIPDGYWPQTSLLLIGYDPYGPTATLPANPFTIDSTGIRYQGPNGAGNCALALNFSYTAYRPR